MAQDIADAFKNDNVLLGTLKTTSNVEAGARPAIHHHRPGGSPRPGEVSPPLRVAPPATRAAPGGDDVTVDEFGGFGGGFGQ